MRFHLSLGLLLCNHSFHKLSVKYHKRKNAESTTEMTLYCNSTKQLYKLRTTHYAVYLNDDAEIRHVDH